MNYEVLLKYYGDSLAAIEKLMADVPDERLAEQPAGLRNHPAWTLMHLCVGNDFCLQSVARAPVCPPDWGALAAPGSQPKPERSAYPSKDTLLQTLQKQHVLVAEGVRAAPPGHFDLPAPERVRSFAATLGHIVAYMLAAHENNHLGQLQAWKRVAGLGKA
ncbi:DinB family protein [Humisphaera borealis]|uniref:DinB family protein n=1 Tax=Humisphaera borealis TaxID=2807512 RepID=A0A7M2WTT9_9BACT|nr:DinB family protein [Humisphaera borealis]QOV88937.1 DinB family protein [Humisphaera borealis]